MERVASLHGPDAEDQSQIETTEAAKDATVTDAIGSTEKKEHDSGDPYMEVALSLPLQRLRWSDYTVNPGEEYQYTVHRVMRVREKNRVTGIPQHVRIRTEKETADGGVFFNRGVAGSQAYSNRFGKAKPRENRQKGADSPWPWLSRGLEEGLLRFLSSARDSDWAIHAACYEFSYQPVLQALAAARERGAGVRVVYDAKPSQWREAKKEWSHGASTSNYAAIESVVGLKECCIPRREGKNYIQHNKFFILSHHGVPKEVVGITSADLHADILDT